MMQPTSNPISATRHLAGFLSSLILLAACGHLVEPNIPEATWIDLFDGDSLNGWTQVNGKAPYEIVDGSIRGTNVLDTPNSFLATDTQYSDFVLEFESRSVGDANSGVQFRTELAPGTWSGLVGYQLDIDPTERRWTGGIYHEGVHVWRHAMARNAGCQAAYQHGAWNEYRIEAVGQVMATWVNGVPCAHMVSDHHAIGLLALQVHSIGQEASYLGSFTEWRRLRLLEDPGPQDVWLERRSGLVEGWLPNEISEIEAEKGWRSFDLADDAATINAPTGSFEAVIDVQVGEAAEGQLVYALADDVVPCLGAYKILDDSAFVETRPETDQMGSVAGKRAAKNLSEPGRPKRFYPDDGWNRVRLIATADRIEHWLNGVKVIEYIRCDPALTTRGDGAEPSHTRRTTIELVTESGRISTRSAKIRVLSD